MTVTSTWAVFMEGVIGNPMLIERRESRDEAVIVLTNDNRCLKYGCYAQEVLSVAPGEAREAPPIRDFGISRPLETMGR